MITDQQLKKEQSDYDSIHVELLNQQINKKFKELSFHDQIDDCNSIVDKFNFIVKKYELLLDENQCQNNDLRIQLAKLQASLQLFNRNQNLKSCRAIVQEIPDEYLRNQAELKDEVQKYKNMQKQMKDFLDKKHKYFEEYQRNRNKLEQKCYKLKISNQNLSNDIFILTQQNMKLKEQTPQKVQQLKPSQSSSNKSKNQKIPVEKHENIKQHQKIDQHQKNEEQKKQEIIEVHNYQQENKQVKQKLDQLQEKNTMMIKEIQKLQSENQKIQQIHQSSIKYLKTELQQEYDKISSFYKEENYNIKKQLNAQIQILKEILFFSIDNHKHLVNFSIKNKENYQRYYKEAREHVALRIKRITNTSIVDLAKIRNQQVRKNLQLI